MRRSALSIAAALLAPASLVLTASAPTASALADTRAEAKSDGRSTGHGKPSKTSIAVIGDVPYGEAQAQAFPRWVEQISADGDVDFVVHVGDIKSGSTLCTGEYLGANPPAVRPVRHPPHQPPG